MTAGPRLGAGDANPGRHQDRAMGKDQDTVPDFTQPLRVPIPDLPESILYRLTAAKGARCFAK
jgi:hypothetical protein